MAEVNPTQVARPISDRGEPLSRAMVTRSDGQFWVYFTQYVVYGPYATQREANIVADELRAEAGGKAEGQ